MNFVVATPEHVAFQIQRQVTDMDHAENPRCSHAGSPENLLHPGLNLPRNFLRQLFGYGESASPDSEGGY